MKRFVLLVLLALFFQAGSARAEAGEVLYFFENVCESCHPERDFESEFRALTGESLADFRYRYYNVVSTSGQAALDEAVQALSLSDVRLPMAVIDGRVYMGDAIRAEALDIALSRTESPGNALYYLYLPACESCFGASALLDDLPISMEVEVRKIDIAQEPGLALSLFDAFSVPDDERLAPIVLAGDRYYQGVDAIAGFLRGGLMSGEALNTPVIVDEKALPAVGMASALGAGLLGGLNPCALSMMLLFLSLIAGTKRMLRLMGAFLLSKLLTYLLIGTVFLAAFSSMDTAWISSALKIVITLAAAVLAVLNAKDAWAAFRGRYGDIKNQLPAAVRRGLGARITGALVGNASVAAVFALGAVVAAGEFLCAGQVYLATLLSTIEKGSAYAYGTLVIYCLSFLLPFALLGLLVARGKSAFELSEFMRGHMPLVKLLTAIFFVFVALYAWYK